jgi:hypothetical protein
MARQIHPFPTDSSQPENTYYPDNPFSLHNIASEPEHFPDLDTNDEAVEPTDTSPTPQRPGRHVDCVDEGASIQGRTPLARLLSGSRSAHVITMKLNGNGCPDHLEQEKWASEMMGRDQFVLARVHPTFAAAQVEELEHQEVRLATATEGPPIIGELEASIRQPLTFVRRPVPSPQPPAQSGLSQLFAESHQRLGQ